MKFVRLFLAGLWITASEFFRNQLLLIDQWTGRYDGLGLTFRTTPVNGIMWMLWSFLFAGYIFWLRKNCTALVTVTLAWISAFPMMWITLYNLQVLPFGILPFALPLSIIEVVLAVVIIGKPGAVSPER